jgi:Ca2+-transporting ATPase
MRVTRNGHDQEISIHDMLVGDIVYVNCGDSVPADGILIQSYFIEVDQSSVTGESRMVRKKNFGHDSINKEDVFLISGTKIEQGNGKFLVLAVGTHSFNGMQRKLIQEDSTLKQTPLQKELDHLSTVIGKFGFVGASLILFIFIVHLLIEEFALGGGWDMESTNFLISAFIVGVTIIVVAIPEGLPLAVTISLAFSVNQMRKEKSLVRHLHAVESMGCVDNICSDKTGTLTQNRMHVLCLYYDR